MKARNKPYRGQDLTNNQLIDALALLPRYRTVRVLNGRTE